jgi:hypothetical protein
MREKRCSTISCCDAHIEANIKNTISLSLDQTGSCSCKKKKKLEAVNKLKHSNNF